MQKPVSELSGAELDYLIAKIEGIVLEKYNDDWLYSPYSLGYVSWSPTKIPEQAYPIIERDRININSIVFPTKNIFIDKIHWQADIQGDYVMTGKTALIAAMRCKVASVYGELCRMCDLKKQWDRDVAGYGDDAYLWYTIKKATGCVNQGMVDSDVYSNDCVESVLLGFSDGKIERKDSAALPFDLEQAKTGDVVEVKVNNEIIKLMFAKETTNKLHFTECGKPNIKISVRKNEADSMLRMTTPPKVSNEKL